MRAILMTCVLVACGGDDGIHEVGDCVSNPAFTCELACRDFASMVVVPGTCDAETTTGETDTCDTVSEFEGVRGCCFSPERDPDGVIRFGVCQ